MKAILIATDEHEKLSPLTAHLPAPMLPIVNRPVMEYAVEALARADLKEITVALYRLGGSIESYFGDGKRWGVKLTYALQRQPYGNAGAVKWSAHAWNETFVVLPADAFFDFDLRAALEFHRVQSNLVTCLAAQDEKSTGAYICEPRILERIPARRAYDMETELLPALRAQNERVGAYTAPMYFNALTGIAMYQGAQNAVLSSMAPRDGETPRVRHLFLVGQQIAPGIWVGRNHAIHPTAQLAPPVVIGDNCFIGKDVELGPNAVLGADVIVDDEATIQSSTVLASTYIGKLVNVKQRIVNKTWLIDTESGQGTQVTDAFLLAESGPSAIGNSVRRAFDALIALLVLLATLPATVLIGLLVLLTSGKLFARPRVVVAQQAVLGTEPRVETAALLHFATRRADHSFTLLGNALERWEIHRWLNVWNILRGELAWVGIAPLPEEQAARLTEEWQHKRYECRAGFTGLWYVQTDTADDLDAICIADAYYAATQSTGEDWRIVMQTPRAWWRRATRSDTRSAPAFAE